MPLTGWLARRVGEVKLFTISVLLFSVASALCGFAHNFGSLIAFRLLQGLVSGPMVPLSQTILMRSYPPEKRGLALGLWAMTVIVAPIFGPVMGGYITDNFTWPWIFYINVPIGIFSAAIAVFLLRGHETKTTQQRIDAVGLSLLVIGGSNFIVTLAIVAAVSLAFMFVWELTEKEPVIELSLFRDRNFAMGVLITSLGFLALVLSPMIGQNMHRMNLRVVASVAFFVFAGVSYWNSTFTLDTPFHSIIYPRLIQGIGVACFFVPMTTITLSSVSDERLAGAAGLSNFLRTLSGAIGTAVSTTFWENDMIRHHAVLTESVTAYAPATSAYSDLLSGLGLSGQALTAQLDCVVSAQAYMMSTNDFFRISCFAFLALAAMVWPTRPKKGASATTGH